jgi:hypothetical protein
MQDREILRCKTFEPLDQSPSFDFLGLEGGEDFRWNVVVFSQLLQGAHQLIDLDGKPVVPLLGRVPFAERADRDEISG